MKVQPRVFTAKSSEPQAVSSDAMGGGSGVAKFDEAEWWTRLQNKPSPKGKRKTKTVNQKPVKIKKMYALPREALWTMKSSKL